MEKLLPDCLSLKGDDSLPTVYDRVKDIVVEKLMVDEAEVNEDSNFMENLEADSLAMVELIMAMEEEFFPGNDGFRIPDEDAGEIATLKDAVTYLKGHGVVDN